MVSNTHDYDRIVVSKEVTTISSSKNTYDLNEYDITKTSFFKLYDLSKNEEQMTSYVQPDGDSVENKEVTEAIILDDNNDLSHIEGEITVCDTCGIQGFEDLLVICCNCEVGAEHTYCMMKKIDKVPNNWSCYECTEELDGMQEEKGNEETNSRKRKADAVINYFEASEKISSQRQSNLSNLLNVDLTIKLDEVPGIDINKVHGIDLNIDPNIEIGEVPGIDINEVHNKDLNVHPNVNTSLGHVSSLEAGSSSNFQTQCAKEPRMDTKLPF